VPLSSDYKFLRNIADDVEVETEVRKWLKLQSKEFCAAAFEALVKRYDRCIGVGGGYMEE
jgi:hypothetical protein